MKQKLTDIIKKNFTNSLYFYKYLKYKIFIVVGLSILVGILDGFGLTMFLPLLQMVSGDTAIDPSSMSGLGFLITNVQDIGIPINLYSILLMMLFFFIAKGAITYYSLVYKVVLQQSFIRKLRLEMISLINRMKYKVFVKSDVGRIQNTLTGEVNNVVNSYVYYFQAFQEGVLVAVYMSFAFFVDFQFAILVSIGAYISNYSYKYLYRLTILESKKITKSSHSYQGLIIQFIANFKYLKATGLSSYFTQKMQENIYEIENSRKKIDVLSAILSSAREPMLIAIVVAVILIQVLLFSGSLGGILISLLFFYRALNSLTTVQTAWNRFLSVSGSLSNVQNFQNELKSAIETNGTYNFTKFNKKLQIVNADFAFDNYTVLYDINLEINKNETIALVGESGSGKTTLVNILAGLLPLNSGNYYIDDLVSTDLNISSFQQRIGYITQEPIIFNDTIYNNVTMWAEKNAQNIERFNIAIQKASINDFINSLKLKEESLLGNNGINLSGGQKQRISIARELYKDIDILIMDEATSALDSETEKDIQNNIDMLKGRYTIIIVAHRLSTIKNADRIVFMNKGRIEAIEPYNNLLNVNQSFKRMVELQEL